jgi:membrane protein
VFETLKRTVREFLDDEAPRLAAALSYYTVFSLPPILILILLVTGVFADPDVVESRLLGEVEGVLGSDAAAQIGTMVSQAADFGGGLLTTVLTVAALAFGATGAFYQLQSALNKAWGVAPAPESGLRDFVVKRLLSFAMILGVAFLLLVSLALSALLTRASVEIAQLLPGALTGPTLLAVDVGLSLVVVTVLFAAIFKVLPDARVAWRDVWIGALVTAVLFVAAKLLFGVFLSMSDPGSAFGAAGSLAVILVWVYFSAMILFLGAEFTQVRARRRGARIEPAPGAVRVVTELKAGPG